MGGTVMPSALVVLRLMTKGLPSIIVASILVLP
jgi:hypothetical protein